MTTRTGHGPWVWSRPLAEIPASERTCTHCGKPLTGVRAVMLEGDTRSGFYYNGGVSPQDSQGWFQFGPTCAKALVLASLGRSR